MDTFLSRKLEFYFLPDGGVPGVDELPIHSTHTALTMETDGAGSTARILTYGQARPLQIKVLQPGQRGVLTVLDTRPSNLTRHFHVLLASTTFSFSYDDDMELEVAMYALSPIFDGTYTVQRRTGRIRLDQGDGTFLERPITFELPLDELIMNRGWT